LDATEESKINGEKRHARLKHEVVEATPWSKGYGDAVELELS